MPTSVKFPRPVVFAKDTQKSHSFLKEYERGHTKHVFLELSTRPQGTHKLNWLMAAQLLNCLRLLFGNTRECKSPLKALHFTTSVVMTSVFKRTKCQTKPSVHLVTARVCQTQHIQKDGRCVLLGRKHKRLNDI